jgi:putative ABC transport system permease protein
MLSLIISGALLFVALSISNVLATVADNDFESVSTVFLMIFAVTMFMGVFVVYSSFKYIMDLRIKTLGTFRSIGASKSKCRNLLLFECLFYGIIAGVFAVVIGIVLLLILGKQLSGGKATIIILPLNTVLSFFFCIVLSVLCGYFPIKASEKYSVKEIILQTHKVKEKNKLPALIIGIFLVGIGLLFVNLHALKYNEIFIIFALLFSLAGFVTAASPIIYYSLMFLSWIFKNSLAIKGAKNGQAFVNIAVLLSIAVAVVFMITSANAVLVKATDESFKNYNYGVQVNGAELDNTKLSGIKGNNGVINAVGIYYKAEVEVANHIPLMNFYGLSADEIAFYNFTPTIQEPQVNEIIISKDYLSREKLAVGNKITIKNTEFTIVATINEMFPSGNIGILSIIDYKMIFSQSYFSYIAIQSDTPNETATTLKNAGLGVVTITQMQAKAKEINSNLFTVLNFIIILSTTAGVFGVLNNLLIALNSQKRERAIMRSIGMDKNKSSMITIIQAMLTGLIGGVLGLFGGILLAVAIPAVLIVFEFSATSAPISPIASTLCIGCSVIICVFASLLSLIGKSKTSITQILREEIL